MLRVFARMAAILSVALVLLGNVGCATTAQSRLMFPSPDEMFVTSGDGDIEKPYTPVGQLIYVANGWRIPLPILGLIPAQDVDPDLALRQGIYEQVRQMGGDAIINMSMSWTPPSDGILGLMASGGQIVVYGTVVRR